MAKILLFSILCLASLSIVKTKGQDPEEQKLYLKSLFKEWQKAEIAKGNFWAPDSCHLDWINSHPFNGTISDMWGLPDSLGYKYSYADLNSDGQLDQLVTFTPSQCDGGNASMWTEIEVFTVSKNGQYINEVYMGDGMFSSVGVSTEGFYFYDSIGTNRIYATYINFLDGDGHCCPSIIKPVIFTYNTKELIYVGENSSDK